MRRVTTVSLLADLGRMYRIFAALVALYALVSFMPLMNQVLRFRAESHPLTACLGWVGALFAALLGVAGLGIVRGLLKASYYLEDYVRYDYCRKMAMLLCIFFPFGTVAGGWALWLLSRERVKGLFEAAAEAETPGLIDERTG